MASRAHPDDVICIEPPDELCVQKVVQHIKRHTGVSRDAIFPVIRRPDHRTEKGDFGTAGGQARMKLCVVMVAACIAIPAAAQSPRDTDVGEVLTSFRPGQPVQVGLLRSRWAGRFERVGGDTLFFASPGQPPMAIRFNAIDTLWRQADRSGRGAWIGGTTLGLIGFAAAIIGKLADDTPTSSDLRAQDVGVGLAWGVGLGLVGSLAGRWIGSGFKGWIVVYPRVTPP